MLPLLAVRTHYYLPTPLHAQQILPSSLRQRMLAEDEEIPLPTLPNSPAVTLKRKPLHKPLHCLRVRRRVGKKSGKESRIVQSCRPIRHMYDYEDMCDLVSHAGDKLGSSDDPYAVDRNKLLDFVRDRLEARIVGGESSADGQQSFAGMIRPESFLKNYNLAPPKCDFFLNRLREKERQTGSSFSIGYEDILPQQIVQPPPAIKESELFALVSGYFSRRPCWLKNVLLVQLRQAGAKVAAGELKTVLRYISYTFRNGPWKHTFCAFGYDPRLSPRSVIYQNVSLKLKKKQAEDYQDDPEEELYDPTFTDLSTRCIRAYQLGDVALTPLQQMLQGKLISGEGICSKEHGWLSSSEHALVLRLMKSHREAKIKQN